MPENKKNKTISQVSKRCPNCLTYLPVDAKICSRCKKKVGEVDAHGMAKKPIDWLSYIISFLSALGLGLYIWWLFFK
jgi:predicted amidophosphoribosyltransferase